MTAPLIFGKAARPVACGHNLVIGNGKVYPEINFTLPAMMVDATTWPQVLDHYRQISDVILRAANRLQIPGLVVEFELLPPMTEHPEWGAEITRILAEALKRGHVSNGLRSALRVTPVDLRDAGRPPSLRAGRHWDATRRSFVACASAGAHFLSIESVGGKEVHDEALMFGDLQGIIFALAILAPRDMQFLWSEIVRICRDHDVLPGADSACGFANTAMQLASQSMIPEVLAAVIRAASSVRSLVAVEQGAVGPSKDCAYEGPILKAITGIPISMEGKSASCAHFSPVGNVAASMCDLWSNESVQNIRLLSGLAPEAYLELLAYDCRLFNEAIHMGVEETFQKMMVESDTHLSPQALVLSPTSTVRIASAISAETSAYHRTRAAAREAYSIIREAVDTGHLQLKKIEEDWMERIARGLDDLPESEETFTGIMMDAYGTRIQKESYGL